jgi:phosphate transport system ATP-binding protein
VAISVQDPPERAGLPSAIDPSAGGQAAGATLARDRVFSIENLTAFYGDAPAIRDVSLEIYQRMVTAIIGPSGCGKSTFIRCLNRMNDVVPNFKTEGRILYRDVDLQARTSIRWACAGGSAWSSSARTRSRSRSTRTSRTGPASWAQGRPRRQGRGGSATGRALGRGQGSAEEERLVALGRPQQRLCIARCLAIEPEVILMDEPASALDPIATTRIEDLMHELKRDYTIVVVTHNMQQARAWRT